jgi:hypothetical protein
VIACVNVNVMNKKYFPGVLLKNLDAQANMGIFSLVEMRGIMPSTRRILENARPDRDL